MRQPQREQEAGLEPKEGGMPGGPQAETTGALTSGAQAAAVQLQLAEVGQVQPCGAGGRGLTPALPPNPWPSTSAPLPAALWLLRP